MLFIDPSKKQISGADITFQYGTDFVGPRPEGTREHIEVARADCRLVALVLGCWLK